MYVHSVRGLGNSAFFLLFVWTKQKASGRKKKNSSRVRFLVAAVMRRSGPQIPPALPFLSFLLGSKPWTMSWYGNYEEENDLVDGGCIIANMKGRTLTLLVMWCVCVLGSASGRMMDWGGASISYQCTVCMFACLSIYKLYTHPTYHLHLHRPADWVLRLTEHPSGEFSVTGPLGMRVYDAAVPFAWSWGFPTRWFERMAEIGAERRRRYVLYCVWIWAGAMMRLWVSSQ